MSDMSWVFYAMAALSAVLVKAVDQLEDVLGSRGPCKYALALLYGALIGYAISFASFSTLWLGVLFAQLVAGKIDRPGHMLGFLTALAFAVVLGVKEFAFFDFFVIFIFAALDEMNVFNAPMREFRLGLKLAAMVFGFFSRWDYFIAIMIFDTAYYLTGRLFPYTLQRWLPGFCVHNGVD